MRNSFFAAKNNNIVDSTPAPWTVFMVILQITKRSTPAPAMVTYKIVSTYVSFHCSAYTRGFELY